MEQNYKFPVLCTKAQMFCTGLALEEERDAPGKAPSFVQVLYFQFGTLILFRFLQ